VNWGLGHINFTIKAPPGGILSGDGCTRYDVDIQKVKSAYFEWRWKFILTDVGLIVLLITWIFFISDSDTGSTSFFQAIKAWFYEAFFTWQGWSIWGLMGVWFLYKNWGQNVKKHFQCPFTECNTEIVINEKWECPYCRDEKITKPFLFRTFFDKCKDGHKPESYQCPTCAKEGRPGVFELIPNGRTDKFARKAESPVVNQPPLPHPPEQPRTGEVLPRDNSGDRFY
jgi:hypothetical protein